MKKEKLENKKLDLVGTISNKPIKLSNKTVKPKKSSDKYKVIESFCGIEKGQIMTIKDKGRAGRMISKKLIKKC